MKSLTLSITVIVLLLSSPYSFSKSLEVDISVKTDTGFPTLSIANPSGKDIVIQPISSELGSIGFEKAGKIYWLKGKPEKIADEAEKYFYQWEIDASTMVQLQFDTKDDEIDFDFTLKVKDQSKATQWFININATQDEYFTGIFERVVDGQQNNSWAKGIETAMNLRGERIEMKLKPTVSAYAPFYLSSNNYGFFVEGTIESPPTNV